MKYYLYIIRCEDGYLYTGITFSLNKRMLEHKKGLCRNTKNREEIVLCYFEELASKYEAAKREKEIKGWRREKKEQLFKEFGLL